MSQTTFLEYLPINIALRGEIFPGMSEEPLVVVVVSIITVTVLFGLVSAATAAAAITRARN